MKCAPAIHMKAAHGAAAFCAEALSAILFMRGTQEVCPIAAETFVHMHAITSLVGKVATPAAFRDRVSLIVEKRHRIDSVSDHRRYIRDQGNVDRDPRQLRLSLVRAPSPRTCRASSGTGHIKSGIMP